jgi:molybdopterin molybdotransferase
MAELLNVDEAVRRIVSGVARLPDERVSLDDALGRVLAADVESDVNLPPFANSSMDGFAVRAADVANAAADHPISLRVVMDIPAGASPVQPLGAGQAARIMTGAPLPSDADAIVPVEDTDQYFSQRGESALLETVSVLKASGAGAYVRPVGEDIAAGQIVLTSGTLLRPQELGILAALGYAEVPVVRRPRVALVSSGDELVSVGEPLAPGKIRDSNSYTLAGLVRSYGGQAIRIPVARDTLDDVRDRFRQALDSQPDVILSSAGVSVGVFDVVRTVLDEMGKVDFWRINLRPGKPLAYGHLGGVPFFGLPGNPVSAMVTFDVFVRPVLLKLSGRPDAWPTVTARTGEEMTSDGRRSYIRVRLTRDNGQWVATTTGTQSSGALTSMVKADGLLIIPEDVRHVPAGTALPVRLLSRAEDALF